MFNWKGRMPTIYVTLIFYFPEVEEVVDCVVYLLSNRASMVHGTLLPVEGGFLVYDA